MKRLFLIGLIVVFAIPAQAAPKRYSYGGEIIGGRPVGCPWQFCGCGVSLKVFGRIIPDLNLARNWFRFPPARPAAGMVAVRRHHVFYIEAVIDEAQRIVQAYDPNSGGHKTRRHVISLAGYSVRDPSGGIARNHKQYQRSAMLYKAESF